MTLTKSDLFIGQNVYIGGVNRHGKITKGVIVTVGTKLVGIKEEFAPGQYYSPVKYRLDTQTINDNYGHSYFITEEQYVASEQEKEDIKTLKEFGYKLDFGSDPKHLHAVAELLRELR